MHTFLLSLLLIFTTSILSSHEDPHVEGKLDRFKDIIREYEALSAKNPQDTRLSIALGDAYYSIKDYPHAIAMYQAALKTLPDNTSIKLSLANAYLADAEKDESRKYYREVLNMDPRSVEALAGLGRLEALEYHFRAAEEYYNRAIKIDPYNANLLYYMADLKIDLKEYAEATKILVELKSKYPKYEWIEKALQRAQDGPILDKLAKIEDKGEYTEAIKRYKEELKSHQGNIDFYLALARTYTLSKQPTEAISLLKSAMNIDPTSKAINMALGQAYLANMNFVEAKKYFELSLNKGFDDAGALTALGKLYFVMGDEETAENYYKMAIKANPISAIALSSYALFKLSQKNDAEALKIYQKILDNDPKANWAKQSMQNIQFDTALKKNDEKELLDLIAATPNYMPYYIKIGRFYIQKKQYQAAIHLFLKGLKEEPDSVDVQIALANAYLLNGSYGAAKSLFEEILATKKNNAESLAGLGKLAELDKRDEDAKKLYKQALAQNPKNLTALNYLSQLLIAEKNYEEARAILEKIKKEDPNATWVDKSLTDVRNGPLLSEIKSSIEKKDIKKAKLLYEQLLIAAPKNEDYFLKAGLFYHYEKEYENAIATYLRGLKIAPDNARLYAGLGFSYLSNNKAAPAHAAFIHALKLNPENPDALAGMASIATRKKKYIKADEYLSKALDISPENDASLSSLGNLRMEEKKYPEAAEAYLKLLKIKPNEKWIRLLYENALNGEKLNEIHKLVESTEYGKAATLYAELVQKYPDNPLYSSGLGLMYLRLRDYGKATEVYKEALKTSPEDNDLLVSLGYSYLLAKNWGDAFDILTQSIEADPHSAEALAGLGRVHAESDCGSSAEYYYKQALEIQPDNESALNFYGILLLKEKRFHEAEKILAQLQKQLPDAVWVKRLLKDAQDGPIIEIAKTFSDDEEFENAATLYSQLVFSSPDDPARYEPLGSMFVNLFDFWGGIAVYETGLQVDPDAFYLWRSIAFAYIYLEEFDLAWDILSSILFEHPDDAESWAGLGRIEALSGSWECAEQYYLYALSLSPENQTILGFYADLLRTQGYYCSSLSLYNQLRELNDGPKWIRTSLEEMLNRTMATITLQVGNHEEKQWDPSVHRNSAKYTVDGFGALINYPLCDGMAVWGRMYYDYFQLRDLLTERNIYSLDAMRAHVGFKYLYNPHWTLDLLLGATNYSRYRRGTSDVLQGTIFEPGVRFSYKAPMEQATIGLWSESTIVARNFTNNTSKLVGKYFLNGTYQRQIIQRGFIGFDVNAAAYNDYVDNTSATALGWFQWRPPIYSNNILFRYHLKYGKFAENIPDYYTYKDQWVNYFQVTFENYWRVCWADSFYTSLSFGHGFQNTYTRFSQFIVLAPNVTNPLRWDNRQYNIVNMKGIYKWQQLKASLALDYYSDTEKYRIATLIGELTWRF